VNSRPLPATTLVAILLVLSVLVLLPLGRSAELPLVIAAIAGAVLLARGRLRPDGAGARLVLVLFACYWLPALLSGFAAIEPGKTVKLAPGGYHLMLMDLKGPFKQGDKVPVTLEFEKAGKVTLSLDVQGVGAQAPAHDHMDHSGKKM